MPAITCCPRSWRSRLPNPTKRSWSRSVRREHGSHSERRYRKTRKPGPDGEGRCRLCPQLPAAQEAGGRGYRIQQKDRGAGASGASMEVILKEDIEKLGSRGQMVKVAAGYARNYLLPKKLAVAATESNKKIVEQERQARAWK